MEVVSPAAALSSTKVGPDGAGVNLPLTFGAGAGFGPNFSVKVASMRFLTPKDGAHLRAAVWRAAIRSWFTVVQDAVGWPEIKSETATLSSSAVIVKPIKVKKSKLTIVLWPVRECVVLTDATLSIKCAIVDRSRICFEVLDGSYNSRRECQVAEKDA